MTPAVPPLPTIWNLPFQPSLGIQTSNCTAGLVTPATRQIGTGSVPTGAGFSPSRSEEHTSELQSHLNLVCRLLLEKKKKTPCLLNAAFRRITCPPT